MKSFLAFVVLGILLVLAGCASKEPEPVSTIKIGFVAPLSGDAVTYGEGDKNGVLLALEDINNAGGINGKLLEVIFEDDKCSGKDAVTAVQKLINVDGVKVVLGSSCSGATLAMVPITQENKVVLFTSIATNPKIKSAGDFVFRNMVADDVAGKDLLDLVAQKHKNAALLSENSEYAQGLRTVFKENAVKKGLEIIADEVFEPGTQDFKSHLTKIKAKNPEAFFVNPQTDTTGGLILKQAKDLGIKTKYYMAWLGGSKALRDAAGADNTEGLIWVETPSVSPKNTRGQELLQRHRTKFGSDPIFPMWMAISYDRMQITANALRACGENTDCIRDWLYNMPSHDGISGNVHFDKDGEIIGISLSTYTVQDGEVREFS